MNRGGRSGRSHAALLAAAPPWSSRPFPASSLQYRVTQDFWDEWADADGPDGYPTGLRSKLGKAVEFAAFFGRNGSYADLDMMPLGDSACARGAVDTPLPCPRLPPPSWRSPHACRGAVYHMAQGPFGPSNLTHNEQVRATPTPTSPPPHNSKLMRGRRTSAHSHPPPLACLPASASY